MSEARHLVPHGADERQEVVLHDHRDDIGVGELVGDLALLVGRVHRARNGARAGDGEEAHDVLGPIRHEEAHAVARSDTEGAQRVGEGVHEPFELAKRDARVPEDDGLVLGVERHWAVEHLPVWDRWIRERRSKELGRWGRAHGSTSGVRVASFQQGDSGTCPRATYSSLERAKLKRKRPMMSC